MAWALFQILSARDWLTLAVVSAEDGARAWWLVQALEQIAIQSHQPLRALNVLEVTVARATAMAHALSPAGSARRVAAGGEPTARPSTPPRSGSSPPATACCSWSRRDALPFPVPGAW